MNQAGKMKVEVMSRKLVKPSTPTPTNLQRVKLSLFDHLAPPRYINIIIYYSSAKGEDEEEVKNQKREAMLEKSLPEALTKFYPLSGRLNKDDLMIDCNDKGVEYLEAQVEGQLAQLLQNPEIELLNQLVPWDIDEADLVTSPFLAIQINEFKCGGLAVGLRVSHKVADVSTASAFMNEWAKANRSEVSKILPNFELSNLFPPGNFLGYKKPPQTADNIAPPTIVTKCYTFNATIISKLKARASGSGSAGSKSQPTRLVAVMALLWKALIGVSRAKHGHLRPSLLSHPINLRGKTTLPNPMNSFGNFYVFNSAKFMGDSSKMEFEDLVGLLQDSITSTTRSLETKICDDISFMATNIYEETYEERFHNDKVDFHPFTTWCRLPIYEADFGWGKPCWVSGLGRPFEMVCLIDSRVGDGIEAWVSLTPENMVEFERDQDILELTNSY